MNLRDRLKIRGLVMLFVSVVESLVNLISKLLPKTNIETPKEKTKPKRNRPLKRVIDAIDDIPLPWKK